MLTRTLIAFLALVCVAEAQTIRRALPIDAHHYTLRAGDRIEISVPAESLAFVRNSAHRFARASGHMIRNFAVGPTPEGDKLLLGVPLTTEPGEYSVEISFAHANEERMASVDVTVTPFATPVSSSPPVVLLDGFQLAGCPLSTDSSGTFGNLQTYLAGPPNNIAPIYFFENCTECPNCSIEQLGADFASFVNSLPYPQVDVVAHSMGGLIVRSYLSGKQSNGFSPPSAQKIRKAIFLASPHFGAFATNFGLAQFFAAGTQTNEMKPGSQFIWDLGTWNQFGDDLRGLDAISLVGVAGPSGQSDGVVESTSASLDFAVPGRTRVLTYCHIPPGTAAGLAGLYLACQAPGIAHVDSPSHSTYVAVSSFLLNQNGWQVGSAPSQDPDLSKYGGLVVAEVTATDQYATPTTAAWGTLNLSEGGAPELYYRDFVSGSGTFNFGSSTCGPWNEIAGLYSLVRCKVSPAIYSVGPLLSSSGRVVQAGGTITISGTGFGTQCSSCAVTAANPTPTTLQVLSWSDSLITAILPASLGVGIATISVTASAGFDAINIMARQVVQPPIMSLSVTSLKFLYTVGAAVPSPQIVTVNNSSGGSLSYSVTSSAAWLLASTSGSTISVSVNPAGLGANTYSGLVTVTAPDASNSPQSISVSLAVTGAAPTLAISSIASSASGLSGPIAPGELFTIKGTNLGPATGVSFSVANGTVSRTLAGTTVMVGSIPAPILYTSSTQVNAVAPYEISGQSQVTVEVQYGGASGAQQVQVQSASPGAFTFDATGVGTAVAANQDGSFNGPSRTAAKGSIVTIYWTGGGQTSPSGVTGGVVGSVLKWLTLPISVTVGDQPATVMFDGAAPTFVDGVDQLNIQLSPNTPSGAQPLVITVGGVPSPATAILNIQ